MKKQFLPALLIAIVFTHLSAQTTITLSFTAEVNGIHQPLDSILIQNLTQGGDTTLVGADTVLVLEHGIGINDGVVQSGNQMILYPAFPNPVAHTSTIRLWLPKDAPVTLRLHDLAGREQATFSRSLRAGEHSFTLTTGRETGYLLVAEAADQRQVQKLISLSPGDDNSRISYAEYQPSASRMRKGKSAFPWIPGDDLRFVGYSSLGVDTIEDDPVLSALFTFQYLPSPYPPGTVHCDPLKPTAIVDVTNPITGKIWMDRNLGAAQVATSSTDSLAYGDIYQWGRIADGHQCRTSATNPTLSSTNLPGHGHYITINNSPFDWRSPQYANLWQGVNGENNPCPTGYRLPTEAELVDERQSWSPNINAAGALASPLKLPLGGARNCDDGSFYLVGTNGYYWTSTVHSIYARHMYFYSANAFFFHYGRAAGLSVRCLKD